MSRFFNRARLEQPRARRRRRSKVARAATAAGVFALTFALARMQVLSTERYSLMAKENRLRAIDIRAPRGTIYDRYGKVVAENRVGYQVSLMPGPADSMRAALARLRPVLALSDRDIQRATRRWQRARHYPMVVTNNASPAAVARLEERRHLFPGMLVYEYPNRYYPAGEAIAHLIGYIAEISETELKKPEFQGYRQGRWIGRTGLEKQYETVLGGEPGMRYLEVDAAGRIKRWIPESMGVPAIPGRDLHLHLDLDLQRYIPELLRDAATALGLPSVQGAFAALDPRTGGVLALYSTPSYDPNLFTGGIAPDLWRALSTDRTIPLLDRATGAAQPPGSTFKLQVAAIALGLGVLKPEDYMPVPCSGGLSYGGRYARCWGVHGRQALIGAIFNSCDVYFYQVGIRIGLKRFLSEGTRLGFSRPTGIDLPTEISSIFPEDLTWWEQRFGYKPYENEIMSLSIGQGAVTLTPLKLAHMFVPLARLDGKAPAPRLVRGDTAPPISFELPVTPEQIQILRSGMRRVVAPPGTAALARLPGWDFMGKTGTAQNPLGKDHAWFVGIGGPLGGEPEIVAALILYGGEHGYIASGPISNAINFYLSRKHGRPFERYPTPRERLPRGLPVDWAWYEGPVVDPVPAGVAPARPSAPR